MNSVKLNKLKDLCRPLSLLSLIIQLLLNPPRSPRPHAVVAELDRGHMWNVDPLDRAIARHESRKRVQVALLRRGGQDAEHHVPLHLFPHCGQRGTCPLKDLAPIRRARRPLAPVVRGDCVTGQEKGPNDSVLSPVVADRRGVLGIVHGTNLVGHLVRFA